MSDSGDARHHRVEPDRALGLANDTRAMQRAVAKRPHVRVLLHASADVRCVFEDDRVRADVERPAAASATSVLRFAPLSDGTTAFAFVGYSQAWWSSGFVRLEDATSGALLWDYGWECCALGSLIWGDPSNDYCATAALTLDQDVIASHAYALTLHTAVSSAADREGMAIYVSGLDAVPEPPWLPLAAVAVLGLAGAVARSRSGITSHNS